MAMSDDYAIPQTILRHFDLSSLPYSPALIAQTTSRRTTCPDKQLFLDRLLSVVEIDGTAFYPPTNPADLRRLLHAIHVSPLDRLKRDCFFYYLLRDYEGFKDNSDDDGMEVDGGMEGNGKSGLNRAREFAKRRCIPQTWTTFMDGYWELDHGLWETAVHHLSDLSITEVNFIPEILDVLATLVSPPAQACHLIQHFITTTQQILESPAENDIKLMSICSAVGLPEGFTWIRTYSSPEDRQRYREIVWCWVLGSPQTPCGAGTHVIQTSALKQILHLPLNEEEDAHLIHFLSHPPRSISPQALSLLHDLVTLRLIHQGQYQESLQLEKDLAGSSSGGGRDEDRQRRREMIREFVAILPEAQRRVLFADSEILASQRDKEREVNGHVNGSSNLAGNGNGDINMESSWVDIQDQPTTKYTEVAAPTPVRHANPLLNGHGKSIQAPTPIQRVQTNSPFRGPPRFASTIAASPIASPIRNHSGSPFALKQTGSSSRLPIISATKPRPIINDDHLEEPVKKTIEPSGNFVEEESQNDGSEGDENKENQEEPLAPPSKSQSTRRPSRKTIPKAAKNPTPPPEPEPEPEQTPRRPTRASRKSTLPMPGAFDVATSPPPPPPSSNKRNVPAAQNDGPAPSTRSRMTRSASRAVLEEHEPPKRTKTNTRKQRLGSEMTDDGSVVSTGVRRSTRRAGTVGASERGSPTPSLQSENGSRRGRKVVEGSMTPRVTRSRK